jgi:hypothetical protein
VTAPDIAEALYRGVHNRKEAVDNGEFSNVFAPVSQAALDVQNAFGSFDIKRANRGLCDRDVTPPDAQIPLTTPRIFVHSCDGANA